MDRARVFPDFRQEDVLFDDPALIVVRKRSGIPSQAAQPDRPDDLVTRLASFLAGGARGSSASAYLGVHQRLDRDTSGCILFTRERAVNASIARQFERREIQKRYLAAVTRWPERLTEATLDDELTKGEDGTMIVTRRGRGQRAVTRVKVKARKKDRALLELVLETGRTHQARVQLAHAGAPIAGDPLYGGPPAPRLMLHASEIAFVHPTTNRRVVVKDDRTKSFERWLAEGDLGARVYDDAEAFDDALATAIERRWRLGRSVDLDPPERRTTAFRLVNEEGDALPALAVDVYGDHLVAQLHLGDAWDDPKRQERVLDRLGALGFDGVYLKLRPKQANVLVETRRPDVAPAEAVRGASAPAEIVIEEEGVPHRVRLGDGLSTGIFLDQRQNRALVGSIAKGARVLNLFSYTCAFSVVAALGGAKRTVSVDASLAALERGRASFVALGILSPDHLFVGEDAFRWLARAVTKRERFDLVIVDPPSYSSTKKRRFVAESDYGDLIALACGVCAPGARILASCNHRGLSPNKLRRMSYEGARQAGRELVSAKDLPGGADFPPAPGRPPNMKALLLTLDGQKSA